MGKKTLLIYPPLQFQKGIVAKPDGSLSLPYLAGALREADHEVDILDASTGKDDDDLSRTFFKTEELSNGLVRHGMTDDDILSHVADYDVIGVTSVFTPQASMSLNTVKIIKDTFPDKSIIVGGVNARFMKDQFIDHGATAVFHSESEKTIVDFVRATDLTKVLGISTKDGFTGMPQVVMDLDDLPIPAWDLLPNKQYWEIGRPHGGKIEGTKGIRYAEMMTSRGCPFSCSYCHISKEKEDGSLSSNIGQFRTKSIERVIREVKILKDLDVEYVYIEDDSLLAKKKRAIEIFEKIKKFNMKLADVNGVNIAHLFIKRNGNLYPDTELFSQMYSSGFSSVCLPFESGSQRILDKYASKKWSINKMNTVDLITDMIRSGVAVNGNYTIGYPDETMEEIKETLKLARLHMEYGMTEANIFLIVPFPGSTLFDFVMNNGFLDEDWNPDEMKWYEPTMKNTLVLPPLLKLTRELAWSLLNKPKYVDKRIKVSD